MNIVVYIADSTIYKLKDQMKTINGVY